MSFISDVFDFERSALKDHLGKIKEDPERLLIGAGDPASSKLWGKVLNKDYEPLVDQWGGAPQDAYVNAEKRGIDTTAGAAMHQVAKSIASNYAGSYGMERLGVSGINPSLPEEGQQPPEQAMSQQKQSLMQRAEQLRARIEQLKAKPKSTPVKMADGGQVTRTDQVVANLRSYGLI